jgi:hypothetical protein
MNGLMLAFDCTSKFPRMPPGAQFAEIKGMEKRKLAQVMWRIVTACSQRLLYLLNQLVEKVK